MSEHMITWDCLSILSGLWLQEVLVTLIETRVLSPVKVMQEGLVTDVQLGYF